MGKEKVFKSIEEQIEILKNKNMIINDEDYAKEVLLRENYFFFSGYRHLFLQNNSKLYIKNTNFEEVYSLFKFDRSLRNILFKNLLTIENNVKSIISYQLSKKYGYREQDYLNLKNFTKAPDKKKQVNDLISKMKRQIKFNVQNHSATMHYVENYKFIPLWVLVKVLSFGIVSELFTILTKEDQYDIVDLYGLEIDDFINYLTILSNYRNICAHEDIVFENKTQRIIEDTKYHRLLKIPLMDNEYIYGKNDLFALIIIIKSLLQDDETAVMLDEIKEIINELENNLKTINIDKVLNRMGFPLNWYEIKNIKKKELF